MKIILSRKGFDSGTGKVPSPILPSGELCSLPIPELLPKSCSKQYQEILIGNNSLGIIVNDLTRGKIPPETVAHLDPDLNFESIPRLKNWQPIFGQAGAAERHLQNNNVNTGDVFIFFGWFKQVEKIAKKYQYIKNAPDLHIIFGWLQIKQRIAVDNLSEVPLWGLYHPHCKQNKYAKTDSIYIASEQLKLPNRINNKPGAGIFKKFHQALCLTAKDRLRSVWQLPIWFHPQGKNSTLTYHQDFTRWTLKDDCVLLNSVGRGQEFILDCEDYPQALDWLFNLLHLYH
jgi:hypothetical protein